MTELKKNSVEVKETPLVRPQDVPGLVVVAVIVLSVWVGIGIFVSDCSVEVDIAEALESGGSFFTALAFVAAGYAVLLQRKSIDLQRIDLELQRVEMQKTREEIEGQKQQMIMQNETIQSQSFENTYFNLLNMHRDMVSKFHYTRRLFRESKECYGGEVLDCLLMLINKDSPDVSYNEVYEDFRSHLGPYFMSLYWIVRYIQEADIKFDSKRKYVSIMRAQLSQSELELIMYNCVYGYGQEKFKPLVEQYALLEHLDRKGHSLDALKAFSPSAYGLDSWDDLFTPTAIAPTPTPA